MSLLSDAASFFTQHQCVEYWDVQAQAWKDADTTCNGIPHFVINTIDHKVAGEMAAGQARMRSAGKAFPYRTLRQHGEMFIVGACNVAVEPSGKRSFITQLRRARYWCSIVTFNRTTGKAASGVPISTSHSTTINQICDLAYSEYLQMPTGRTAATSVILVLPSDTPINLDNEVIVTTVPGVTEHLTIDQVNMDSGFIEAHGRRRLT